MAAPLCKVNIGRPGAGAAHASYITRLSALDPEHKEHSDEKEDIPAREYLLTEIPELDDSTIDPHFSQELDQHELGPETGDEPDRDDDPVWTWNAPVFLTGDEYGIREKEATGKPAKDVQAHETMLADRMTTTAPWHRTNFSLREKTENLRTYFGSKEAFEKTKGGRTHYRVILSFDVPATNKQIKELTNKFLEQSFPKAPAFAAIHRDTEHPHVHLYVHSRQIDGKRVQLKDTEYRSLDEKWANIYAEFAGDRSAHLEHLRKKQETLQWKRDAAEAYREGKPIPPKPERDADRRERLAEQRLSAQRSEARDKGGTTGPRPQANPVMRPRSGYETGRLMAKEHLAREHVAHLIRSDASHKEIEIASRIAHGLVGALERTVETRAQMGKIKTRPDATIYTIEEAKRLAEYGKSRSLPLHDGERAARVVTHQRVARAEHSEATRKAEAFEANRHLWKFEVEGWDRKLSLKDVEQAIKNKQAERLKVLNFIRPSRRALIQTHIDYLGEVKRDIQGQIAARGEMINSRLKAAELRHDVATKQVDQTAADRSRYHRSMPTPEYTREELIRLAHIAERNHDPDLLRHVHSMTRGTIPRDTYKAGVMLGKVLVARFELLKAHDRMLKASRYLDHRQVPIRDVEGRDHSVSVRDVTPRNVAEAITNRLTRPAEQRFDSTEVKGLARQQFERSQQEFERMRQYVQVRKEIATDYCVVARVKEDQLAPVMSAEQLQQIRDEVSKLPGYGSYERKEFERAIPLAEQSLLEREREKEAKAIPDQELDRTQPHERLASLPDQREQDRADVLRDRDSSFRGR